MKGIARLNWEAVARADVQQPRLAILDLMLREPPAGDPGWSAKTIADALDSSLARASHHLRVFRDRGWLVEVGQRRARGAIQTFYVLHQDLVG